MRHWTVSLLRDGRTSREWHVWAETLTIGSHGAAKVRLPLPVEPWALRLTELAEPSTFELAEFTVRVADTTLERTTLWERAQVRIETAAHAKEVLSASEPAQPSTLRTAFAALCLAGITHLTAEHFAADRQDSAIPSAGPALAYSRTSPEAPFVVRPPAPSASTGTLAAGIGSNPAPKSALSSIVLVPSPQQAGYASNGGAPLPLDLEVHHPSPQHASASISWPPGSTRSWKSVDQPPPEPPH